MKKMIRTYDGGGNLGIGPATFMALAKQVLRRRLPKADALGGTSVGSILAGAEAIEMPFEQALDTFKMLCPEIWSTPSLAWEIDPRKPKYDGKGLEHALRSMFGDRRMCDLAVPLFVVAMDMSNGKVKVWDHTDGDLVRDVIRTSCAAPTFLPPVDGKVDGGIVANNPSMCALTGALDKLGWDLKDIWMMSLGTNGDYWKDPHVDRNTNKLAWGKILIESLTRCNEEMATFQSRAFLRERLLRIEPILGRDYVLDDLDILQEYADLWRGLWVMREEEVDEWHKLYMECE